MERLAREIFTPAQRAPVHQQAKEGESVWLIVSTCCFRRAFALQRRDLGTEFVVVHGDLAYLDFSRAIYVGDRAHVLSGL